MVPARARQRRDRLDSIKPEHLFRVSPCPAAIRERSARGNLPGPRVQKAGIEAYYRTTLALLSRGSISSGRLNAIFAGWSCGALSSGS